MVATCSGVAMSFGHFFNRKLANSAAALGSAGKGRPSKVAIRATAQEAAAP